MEYIIKQLDTLERIRSLYEFISDSYNGMRDAQKTLFTKKKVKINPGCSSNCLRTVLKDMGGLPKLLKSINDATKIRNTIKKVILIKNIFEAIPKENI